jgi:pimeloyl-ACP methyl ester carboxylesterase
MMSKNILLVHGAFHDERCWQKLQPHLTNKGFRPHTLTLRGHGTTGFNPYRVSMSTYAQDVCDKLQSIGEPCLVVGHSMGGVVISAAAERRPDLFSAMIYLAAMVPSKKTSLLALHKQFPNEVLAKATRPSVNGTAAVEHLSAKAIFYGKCSEQEQDDAVALLCGQPIRPSFSSVRWSEARLGAVPKHYIECTDDQALFINDQRAMQSHMKFARVETLNSDHSPFWMMPARLADVISGMAMES